MPQLIHSALALILLFTLLVAVHEAGHFLAAKMFKMRVLEFSIGFGKLLYRLGYDGQTAYNIRAFPLGGFVSIAGMGIDVPNSTETTNERLISQESAESDGIDPDGFNGRPVFQRFIVIVAGPIFSFALGWLVLCLIGMTTGFPDKSLFQIDQVVPKSAAADAGFRSGDTVLTIEGAKVDFDGAMTIINHSIDKPLHMTVRNEAGVQRQLTATPRANRQPGEKAAVGRIGVTPVENPQTFKRVSARESFIRGTQITGFWFRMIGHLVQTGAIKDNIGGPVSIIKQTDKAARHSNFELVSLLGQLSLSLGLCNLLPIPIFDGGHIALMLLEIIRRRKLTGEQTARVMAAGYAIVAALAVIVMIRDVIAFFHH